MAKDKANTKVLKLEILKPAGSMSSFELAKVLRDVRCRVFTQDVSSQICPGCFFQ